MEFNDIEANIREKYKDATTLKDNGGYANSIYLSGYCVELALKYAIAKHMKWTSCDVNKFKFLKVHELDFLASLTGNIQIKTSNNWQIVSKWDEKKRYADPATSSESNAEDMLNAVKELVGEICKISL